MWQVLVSVWLSTLLLPSRALEHRSNSLAFLRQVHTVHLGFIRL
jgi:hypothetical protein